MKDRIFSEEYQGRDCKHKIEVKFSYDIVSGEYGFDVERAGIDLAEKERHCQSTNERDIHEKIHKVAKVITEAHGIEQDLESTLESEFSVFMTLLNNSIDD